MQKCTYIFVRGLKAGTICNKLQCNKHTWINKLNENKCKEFLENKTINPVTKRHIKPGNTVYNKILFECQKYTGQTVNYMDWRFKCPEIVKDWLIGKKIGEGAYGNVYLCKNQTTDKEAIIKLEYRLSKGLLNELKIYKYKFNFLPLAYDMGIYKKFRYLVIEKLKPIVPSLSNFKKIILKLENLYKNNISHGDIKFENIMVNNHNNIVLIDYGFTDHVISFDKRNSSNKIGTLIFMSTFSHCGFRTYVNDLESLAYSILDTYNDLPWDGMRNENYVYESKLSFKKNFDDWLNHFDINKTHPVYNFCKRIFSLNRDAHPDYKLLSSFF